MHVRKISLGMVVAIKEFDTAFDSQITHKSAAFVNFHARI